MKTYTVYGEIKLRIPNVRAESSEQAKLIIDQKYSISELAMMFGDLETFPGAEEGKEGLSAEFVLNAGGLVRI
jgi:hypothetical protein